jgi:single-strand DNA-binding protein
MDNARIEVFGTLGKDPESKYTPSGTMVTEVSIAVDMGTGEYKRTDWYKLTIWGEQRGEMFTGMAQKGTYVFIAGAPKLETWANKDGEAQAQLSLNVNEFRILRNGKPRESQETPYDNE